MYIFNHCRLFAIFALDSNNNGIMSYVIKDRGYTLHEHYDDFGLINMNGRVYDPFKSTFLSPDNLQKLPVGVYI